MGVLDGIGDEVGDDLLDATLVDIDGQSLARTLALELDRGFLYTLCQRFADVVELSDEVNLLWTHLHGIGIDIGQHEDVVDKTEQHVAIVVDDAYHLTFLLRRIDGLQQIGEADYGIQRGTNLMGHISQEDGLLMARVVGTLGFTLQLFLFLHDVVDVTPYAEASQQTAILVVLGDAVDLYPLQFGRRL